jgi:segregation and condensation protein B
MTDDNTDDRTDEHLRILEAIIFASDEPVPETALAAHLPEGTDLRALLRMLQDQYRPRGVNLMRAGPRWSFRTAPDLAGSLRIEREEPRRLSRAAVETLATIAYHQPVTRAEIEEIRGVTQSRGTLDVLLDAGWVKPGKRRETPGRPVTWLTTEKFLDHFGLESLKDLPGLDELKAAGLLDARPAVQAIRGEMNPFSTDDEGEPEGEGDESGESGAPENKTEAGAGASDEDVAKAERALRGMAEEGEEEEPGIDTVEAAAAESEVVELAEHAAMRGEKKAR